MSRGCCITMQPEFASGRFTISTVDGSKSNRRSRKSALSTNDCEFPSKSKSQLHKTFTTIPETNSLNCCRNYYRKGSVLSSSIRHFQSSPLSRVKKSIASPLLKWKDLALYLILLLLHGTTVQAISSASAPLTRTDVTVDEKFSVFNGKGPAQFEKRKKSIENGVENGLDFQNLKFIPDWEGTKDVLLISGRNFIYMLNASIQPESKIMKYTERIQWISGPGIRDICQTMRKSKFECNNFIRVMELQEDGNLYVCGTNAYQPDCRMYSRQNFGVSNRSTNSFDSNLNSLYVDSGLCGPQCPCPYNPTKSSVALYSNTSTGFQLFSASIDNFMANDPVLMRKSVPPIYSMDEWFNDPTFVNLVDGKNGKIYLFFRETARKVETGNEPATYSRVAQVCKNDKGGTTVLEERWTSFLKARLKCSIPGSVNEASFTFDNLTSVSNVTTITGRNGEEMDVVFATFTTPWNWREVAMSAVCVFAMRDIENLFDTGRFLSERLMQMEPLNSESSFTSVFRAVPVSGSEVINPRPGKCLEDSSSVTDKTLHFAKEHFLMFDSVNPLYNEPIFISEKSIHATRIAVDRVEGSNTTVLYVGTEDGKVLRIRPNFNARGPKALLLEEMKVADTEKCRLGLPCGILHLNIYRPKAPHREGALFVAFTDRMVRVPLTTCEQFANADCCNVDPACAWLNEKCVVRANHQRATLPSISPVGDLPKECQIQKNLCDFSNLVSTLPDLCAENSEFDLPRPIKGKEKEHRISHNARHRTESVDLRSASRTVNDQPKASAPTVLRRGCKTIRKEQQPELDNSDQEVAELFIKHVLPSISSEFRDTIQALGDKDRQAVLLQQLRNAMMETTKTVLRNHKMDHCLPNESINTLTHSYPLLLREIESWHGLAIRKMVPDNRFSCWEESSSPRCPSRLSFSAPFAPSLWSSLTNLIKEFRGKCDNKPQTFGARKNPNECHVLPGILPCKDIGKANSSLCQVRKCRFSDYAVDVKAFFRHVNDSRNFLPAGSGMEPFRKDITRKIANARPLQGHLQLSVSKTQPFQIYYIPSSEKVKITFHYAQERNCASNERGCSSRSGENNCNAKLERKLNSWFDSVMSMLSPEEKKCQRQIQKADSDRATRDEVQVRRRRSFVDNRLIVSPNKCLYMRKNVKLALKFWSPLVQRAQHSGARYLEDQKSVVFTSRNDVIAFFNQRCPESIAWSTRYRNMKKMVFRERKGSRPSKWVDVEVFVSNEMPFKIERMRSGRVKLKFFTRVIR